MRKPPPLVDRRLYNPGDIIVREGEIGYSFYLVEKGAVEVVKSTPAGEQILGRIEKDGIFGEMALVDDSKRMASVRAVELTTCRVFPREYFYYRLERSDKFIRAIMRIFAAHIRSLTNVQVGYEVPENTRPSKSFSPEDLS